jgi:uncharacterized repeat protein (TIGR02543 family)
MAEKRIALKNFGLTEWKHLGHNVLYLVVDTVSIDKTAREVTIKARLEMDIAYYLNFGWSAGSTVLGAKPTSAQNVADWDEGTYVIVPDQKKTFDYKADGTVDISIDWKWAVDLTDSDWYGNLYDPSGTYTAYTVASIDPLTSTTYKIKYDANGLTTATNMPSTQTKTHGVAITLSSKVPDPGDKTKHFHRWKGVASSGSKYFYPGDTYAYNTDITMYAQWPYKVVYNANGGKNAPPAEYKYPDVALTLTTDMPTRDGYSFVNWNNVKDGTGSYTFVPGGTYAAAYKAATLYAQWEANILKIRYNANGGEVTKDGCTTNSSGLIYYNGSVYYQTAKGAYNEPINSSGGLVNGASFGIQFEGYTFKGWKTSKTATKIWSTANDAITPQDLTSNILTGDCTITLYAAWAANSYTITYTDIEFGATCPEPGIKEEDITYFITETKPTTNGYTFANWCDDQYGLGKSYVSGDAYTNNADLILYAQWKVNTLGIKYHANGGIITGVTSTFPFRVASAAYPDPEDVIGYIMAVGTNVPHKVNFDYDKTVKLASASTFSLSRTGHIFKGWQTSATGGTLYTPSTEYATSSFGGLITSMMLATMSTNITVYASWEKGYYKLTFNINGGNSGVPDTVEAEYETIIILSDEIPTKDNHIFKYWSTSQTDSVDGNTYEPGDPYTMGEDTTLYAIWETKSYSVTYDAHGGDINSVPDPQQKFHGTPLTLSSVIPTKANCRFGGWNTQEDMMGTSYPAGGTYSANENVVLYAMWYLEITKCDAPTNLKLIDNNDNTITASGKIGAGGIGNTATAIKFWITINSSSGQYKGSFNLGTFEGAGWETISTTFSFANLGVSAAKSFFGDAYCDAQIRLFAYTLGAAGPDMYSDTANSVAVPFTWYESLDPPIIKTPKNISDDIEITIGALADYLVTWDEVSHKLPNDLRGYLLRVYDRTTREDKFILDIPVGMYTYGTQTYSYHLSKTLLEVGHTYRIYIKALGTYVDSKEVSSGIIKVKEIKPFSSILPKVTTASFISESNINSLPTYFNPGFGNIMHVSWDAPEAFNNMVKHYDLIIRNEDTNNIILNRVGIHSTKFYVPADVLNDYPAGIYKLGIYINAISEYGEHYSSQIAIPVIVNCVNQCAGAYTIVSEGYRQPVSKRAIAFVKVRKSDNLNEFEWRPALQAFTRDYSYSWQSSNINYELLYDQYGEPVKDENDNPIYMI